MRPDKRALAAGLATVVALGLFSYFATALERFDGDLAVSQAVQSWDAPALDSGMKALDVLSRAAVVVPLIAVAALLMLAAGWRRESGATVAASLIGFGLSQAVKALVARPRPAEELVRVLAEAGGYSFPSATTMLYTAFLGAVVLMAGRHMGIRQAGAPALALLAVLLAIGFARIYLGVHWLSDVVGAYLFGAAVAAWTAWVLARWERRRIVQS